MNINLELVRVPDIEDAVNFQLEQLLQLLHDGCAAQCRETFILILAIWDALHLDTAPFIAQLRSACFEFMEHQQSYLKKLRKNTKARASAESLLLEYNRFDCLLVTPYA